MFNWELETAKPYRKPWRTGQQACIFALGTLLVAVTPAKGNGDDKPEAPVAKSTERPAEKSAEADHLLIQQLLTHIEELEARVHDPGG
jgi:hypothetical protein